MDSFVNGLRKKYKDSLLHHEKQWPPVRGDRLVKLQLMEADKKEGFRAGLPQHGAGEDKVKRTPILHGDLFKADKGKKPVRKAIVEGNAGIGKTTLCTMLTEEWAEGKILTHFNCVLLLPLRDQMASSASSFPDLLALYHPDESICECVAQQIKSTKGKGVLIIADGWDELDEVNRSKQSFLYNLLFGRLLPSASVLLTSRPSASAPLHNFPSVDRLIEVVGFNEENIKQYIEAEFESCPDKAYSLLKQLDNNPLIGSVCSVPLNCAIVCNLWHTLDQRLTTTLTELYTQIVLNVILRNLRKESAVDLSLDNFDCIPEDLQDEFWKTCELAYECLSRNRTVFSKSELATFFPQVLSSSNKFLCFGLLQTAQCLLPVGQGLSFHFIHLSFQEFLAALHLVTLSTEEKIKVVEAHANSVQFDNVWRFVFGLGCTKQKFCSRMVVCLEEVLVDKFLAKFLHRYMLFIHCAFESMNDAVSIKVARRVNGSFYKSDVAKTRHDCVAVFHVLRHSVGEVDIPLRGCGLKGTQLKELTDILSSANGKLQVRQLDLSNNKLTNTSVNDLFERASASFSTLRWLSLNGNKIIDMPPFLHMPSCTSSLTKLNLSDNPLGVSGVQSLETAVQASVLVNLEDLHLANTLTDDADINGALLTTLLPSLASHCPRLFWPDLVKNNLGVPGVYAVNLVLAHFARRYFHLNLNGTELNSEAVILLAECLNVADVQSEFWIELNHNRLGYDGFLTVFRMLKREKCLIKDLELKNTDCSSIAPTHLFPTTIPNLGPPLESSHLTWLKLSKNNFSGDRVFVLAECMRVCISLIDFFCEDCSLTSQDISILMTHLKHSGDGYISKLQKWYLAHNPIDDNGVASLIESAPILFPYLRFIGLWGSTLASKEAVERLYKCLGDHETRMDLYEYGIISRRWEKELEQMTLPELKSTALSMWKKTGSPPKSPKLLSVFLRMWDELCWILSYMVYTRSRYPHLYGLPSELSHPTGTRPNVKLGAPVTNESSCSIAQSSRVRHRGDEEGIPTKKPRLSLSIKQEDCGAEQLGEAALGHSHTFSDESHGMDRKDPFEYM